MKIKVLTTSFLGLISVAAFAQKGELNTAKEQYTKYDGLKVNMAIAKPILMDAKTAIDKASSNTKTSGLPETHAVKASIYGALALQETDPSAGTTDFATAQEAINKAKELDTKKENTKWIDQASAELAQFQLNKGVADFQAKKYGDAYSAFDAARQLRPDDTLTVLYTAISASNASKYPEAITNYNKLLTLDYKKKADVYTDLSGLYLASKDTANALKIIGEGVQKYPNNADMRKREIEMSLLAGQQNDLITKIDAAIKADPNNKTLYYYEGLTYSQAAEAKGKEMRKAAKAASKSGKPATGTNPEVAKLQQEREEDYSKAAEQYKKAVAIDPNYFEAVMNLGYVLIAPAIDNYNSAQQLPINQKKAYDDAMAKANKGFAEAKPYVFKAVELNPKSVDALTNQKSYYLGMKDSADANEVQKKIDALPKQ